mmetsp:Transcript_4271/g.10007  ORF Transcript_4271/g.10007 Transcript_4271/m.10007 type:complete len:213 (+) Transcript_4271:1552-2190(+)
MQTTNEATLHRNKKDERRSGRQKRWDLISIPEQHAPAPLKRKTEKGPRYLRKTRERSWFMSRSVGRKDSCSVQASPEDPSPLLELGPSRRFFCLPGTPSATAPERPLRMRRNWDLVDARTESKQPQMLEMDSEHAQIRAETRPRPWLVRAPLQMRKLLPARASPSLCGSEYRSPPSSPPSATPLSPPSLPPTPPPPSVEHGNFTGWVSRLFR